MNVLCSLCILETVIAIFFLYLGSWGGRDCTPTEVVGFPLYVFVSKIFFVLENRYISEKE